MTGDLCQIREDYQRYTLEKDSVQRCVFWPTPVTDFELPRLLVVYLRTCVLSHMYSGRYPGILKVIDKLSCSQVYSMRELNGRRF
jgi:hypothetical protein